MSNPRQQVYPWLDATWQKLVAYKNQDRLPSALMLIGDEGLGLFELTEHFSQSVFCANKGQADQACGCCSPCVLFKAGSYPDYLLVKPEEGESSIKIDAIRSLTKTLALANQYTQRRIVLIYPADAMPHAAANSLLKTLEEPNGNTTIILVAQKAERLPATIRSRCQLLSTKVKDAVAMSSWLEQQGCNQALQYLNLANGQPLFARELWQQGAIDVRNELFSCFELLVQGKISPIDFSEMYLKRKEYPVLEWLMGWLIDAAKLASQAESKALLNMDLSARLKVLLEQLQLRKVHRLFMLSARNVQRDNSSINKQLMFESFAINCLSKTDKKGIY
ncbi:MAG: hypothetical protein A6F71_02010 [Cycloclasticus sp. symbiont of Poecilosclerida sp. M]|nr:MAG: hypothetical protein A6F71_02010 [Cycloclasticus sp. symbiont of Poecilosclerida sp. M]